MSDPTKTMTPPGKSLKRPTRSPLQELDDDEDLELQDASGSFQDGAVAQMANAVRSEIQRALAPMEQQLSHIHVSLGQRVQEMENTMSQQSYRIEKLEKLFENEGTPRSTTSEKDISLEKKIADLQSQLSALRLHCDWEDTWAQWADFQDSKELNQLVDRANDMLQKSSTRKGHGKSKHAVARDSSVRVTSFHEGRSLLVMFQFSK
ncbi:unnamed protein product [Symbiodinium natans]|uniref:Uncharacterized protein n=1 Tax=Symbiodinium natans TaxID=878477 RepID=A0A812RR43_9DINO|nr:unnamed protein product [Symbiodinium natans]